MINPKKELIIYLTSDNKWFLEGTINSLKIIIIYTLSPLKPFVSDSKVNIWL